jgi:NTP pyrophosphatase (non-canonical NTP hydrolase)
MNSDEYVTNALNTEPQDYSPIVERMKNTALLWELLECFNHMKAVGDRLDVIKRAIFYGKDHDFTKPGDVSMVAQTSCERIGETVVNTKFARLVHAALGLSTEAGEFVEALHKHAWGEDLDLVNLSEELGDVCWYVAIGSDAVKIPLSDIQNTNIEKLKARFPDKFSEENAMNRNLETERKILER